MLLLGLTFVSGIAFGYGLTKYLAQFLSKQKNIEKHNRSVVKIWPNCCGSTVILGEFSCFSYQSFLIIFFLTDEHRILQDLKNVSRFLTRKAAEVSFFVFWDN